MMCHGCVRPVMSETVGAVPCPRGNRRVRCAHAAAKSGREVPEAVAAVGYS
jgi:hypothetical protein